MVFLKKIKTFFFSKKNILFLLFALAKSQQMPTQRQLSYLYSTLTLDSRAESCSTTTNDCRHLYRSTAAQTNCRRCSYLQAALMTSVANHRPYRRVQTWPTIPPVVSRAWTGERPICRVLERNRAVSFWLDEKRVI